MKPNSPMIYQRSGDDLLAEKRFTEAREVLEEGLRNFPDDFWLSRSLAMVERHGGSREAADRAIRELYRAFPDQPQACADFADFSLYELNDPKNADAFLEAALARFPDHVWLNHLYATCAERCRDYSEAIVRWSRLREFQPQHTHSVSGIADALRRLGRMDEAERLLQDALVTFPNNLNIAMSHAWLANARADWDEAVRRWSKLRAEHPDSDRVKKGYSEAIWNAQSDENVDHSNVFHPDDAASLVTNFASLGEDCEFGLVQRHFSAEPLALMRWFGLPASGTLDLLENRLGGVGELEQSALIEDREGYLRITIERYSVSANTLTMAGGVDKTKFFVTQCRRLKFLRDRMLEDLQNGEKIWVYKRNGPVDMRYVEKLYSVLRSFGPNKLLFVHLGDGKIEIPHDGLMMASVTAIGPRLHGGWISPFQEWLHIFRTAACHWLPANIGYLP
jgi:tetratricopeptide (TPR) repeat protein